MSRFRVKVGDDIHEVLVEDINAHPVVVTIGDQQFEVWVQEEEGPLVSAPPGSAGRRRPPDSRLLAPAQPMADPDAVAAQPRYPAGKGKLVRAPMPGRIVSLATEVGRQIERGDLLCVLEAMKMNNQIRAPRAGTIAEILVPVGTQVNYGDPLIRFE